MEVVEEFEKPNVYIHLIPNDVAESLLSKAENLSMKGRIQESIQSFRRAAELYAEIESFLNVRDWEVEDQAERDLIDKTRRTARLKRKYCLSRINVEESKKLKMQGDST